MNRPGLLDMPDFLAPDHDRSREARAGAVRERPLRVASAIPHGPGSGQKNIGHGYA